MVGAEHCGPGRDGSLPPPAPTAIRAVLITALQAVPMAFWWIDTPPLTATLLHARSGRWTLRYANSALEDR
jgi:hypothetical protein